MIWITITTSVPFPVRYIQIHNVHGCSQFYRNLLWQKMQKKTVVNFVPVSPLRMFSKNIIVLNCSNNAMFLIGNTWRNYKSIKIYVLFILNELPYVSYWGEGWRGIELWSWAVLGLGRPTWQGRVAWLDWRARFDSSADVVIANGSSPLLGGD